MSTLLPSSSLCSFFYAIPCLHSIPTPDHVARNKTDHHNALQLQGVHQCTSLKTTREPSCLYMSVKLSSCSDWLKTVCICIYGQIYVVSISREYYLVHEKMRLNRQIPCGLVVRALDCYAIDRRFDSRPSHGFFLCFNFKKILSFLWTKKKYKKVHNGRGGIRTGDLWHSSPVL